MDLDIVGATNPGRYPKISREATYNMFISDKCMVPYPGYATIGAFPFGGQARALFESNLGNFCIGVCGNRAYRIDSFAPFSITSIGTLNTGTGFVEIRENGASQVVISDFTSYYVYDYSVLPVTFEVYDPGVTPGSIEEALGYIFLTAQDSNTFIYTRPNNAKSFPLTSTGSLGSDRIVGFANLKDWIFVFGKNTTKAWRTLGTLLNPFQLDASQVWQYGCLNSASISSKYDLICWIGINDGGNAGIIASIGGKYPVEISTDGISFLMSQLNAPQDCSGFLWQQDGHIFYQVTFYSDKLCLVYDFTNKSFFYATDENLNIHIAKNVINFENKFYFISFINASVYEIGSNFESYDGAIIPRIRVTKPLRLKTYKLFRIKKLEVIAEQGIGNTDPDRPMCMDVSFSKNGGNYFTSPRRVYFANQNNFKWVTRVFKIGAARDICFQFSFIGPGRFVIIGADLELIDADISVA